MSKNKKLFGIGILDNSKYNIKTHRKFYDMWSSMLRRCYYKPFLDSHLTYIGCTVDERWHNFQVFAEWCEQNYVIDYHLDKDILIKGNKVYGPDTCCFVPRIINNLFNKSEKSKGKYPIGVSLVNNNLFVAKIGIFGKQVHLGTFETSEKAFDSYKRNKEFYIKFIANKNKKNIPENVYQALISYIV